MGLERRPHEDPDEGARGRHLARRLAGHAGGRRLVAGARRQAGDRQPDPVRLGQDRQFLDRRQRRHRRREGVRADALQVDGLSHRLRAAEGLLREGRRGGLRGGAGRLRPLQGRAVRAERLPEARRARGLLGRRAGLQVRHHQVRAGRHEPRRRDRFRPEPGRLRHPLRGVRPAEGEAGPQGRHDADLRHRDDLPERRRADDRQERAARGDPFDRQAASDRPAAPRLRRQDRHAAGAANTTPSTRRSRSPTTPTRRPSSWRRAATPSTTR